MAEPKFKKNDRVRVVERPTSIYDIKFAGHTARVIGFAHVDTTHGALYEVEIDTNDEGTIESTLYEKDMVHLTSKDVLLAKAAKLEAELENVRKQMKTLEVVDVIRELQPGAVVHGGQTLIVKAKRNWWHWYSFDNSGASHHSNSEDKAVVSEIAEWEKEGIHYQINPHDQD